MKGYKAFKKGMVCRDKQYKENTIFEEKKAVISKRGMHFCKEPLDVLEYYPLVDDNGNMSEFAEVEALEDCKTDNKKYCTKKLKIGAKIDFSALVQASINLELKKTPTDETNIKNSSGDFAKIGLNGDFAKIGSSGDFSKIGSIGDFAKIGSSGDDVQIGSSGYSAKIGSSGYDAKIGSSGDDAQIGTSGDNAQIGSSGNYAKIGSSGYDAQIGSSGDFAKISSNGNSAKIGSSGNSAQIGSSGYDAQIGSSGDYAQIGSSGNSARVTSNGNYSVICCIGNNSIAKAKIGSWITLSEYKYNEKKNVNIPICVKTEYVDGKKIKANTFYKLKNGKFTECYE